MRAAALAVRLTHHDGDSDGSASRPPSVPASVRLRCMARVLRRIVCADVGATRVDDGENILSGKCARHAPRLSTVLAGIAVLTLGAAAPARATPVSYVITGQIPAGESTVFPVGSRTDVTVHLSYDPD